MEFLKIHSNGQWSLEKKDPESDYKVYRTNTGQLREDHDTKGELHGGPGNARPPKQSSAVRNWGKPASLLPSSKVNQNPGMGV